MSIKQDLIDSSFLAEQLKDLNEKYRNLSVQDRIGSLYDDFSNDEIMLTSSFAATSAMLLKFFSDVNKSQFIDTGYHFKETLIYKDYLIQLYELNVKNITAEEWKHKFTTDDQTWTKDPDLCCSINKVEPLEKIKESYKVWVSGLMRWQSDNRSTLDVFEERNGMIKFYPLLDVTQDERESFIKDHHLPFHPLISKGYFSIGCKHCTVPGKGREGRWNNSPKTECGLHL